MAKHNPRILSDHIARERGESRRMESADEVALENHSAGPWNAGRPFSVMNDGSLKAWVEAGAERRPIATIHDVHTSQGQANLRLVVIAPNMYRLLIATRCFVGGDPIAQAELANLLGIEHIAPHQTEDDRRKHLALVAAIADVQAVQNASNNDLRYAIEKFISLRMNGLTVAIPPALESRE